MKFGARLVFLGLKQKRSQKGNDYLVGLFMDEADTLDCMVKMEDVSRLSGLQKYHDVDIDIECSFYNGNPRLTITDIRPVIGAVDKKAV